ncbi:MAG: efflux RND transporter permease subunit [Spirochaetia bacterium]|nr:efflux RND transporter permease subunit [Spirochaetia bacterium]
MENHKGFSIGRFSVTKPVLVNVLMITVLTLGILSLVRLPQEQFAEIPFFWVNVIVPYPGVGAEDLESSVTIPVENAFQGIDKLKKISSTTSEGLSVVRVEFDDGISKQEFKSLYQDAQTRFSQVSLPDGILTPIVDDFSSADFLPVIEVVISGNLPYEDLREQAVTLKNKILKVKDVSDVELLGLPDRQIMVNLDSSRLVALGLTVNEVVRAIGDQNSAIPSGTLSTDSREYLLRTLGSIRSISDFESVIVRRSATTEGVVRVSDVAEVVDGFDPDSSLARFNGNPSVNLRVTKVVKGSSVAVVDGVTQIVEQARLKNTSGAKLTLFNDSTVQIASSLSVLSTNALMGLFLLVLILWLFIGLRNALITALGIPVTFALTFLVLDLLGETINTNTLFGLVLVLGLIVDHAIVIIENSYRLQSNGMLRHDAAIEGSNQVIWPVIAATATTVAAFLPLMLLPGTIGKFLRVIPLTVTIALIVSTGEALFFLPSHYAEWGPREKAKRKKKREPGAWFDPVQRGYVNLLAKAYRFKGLILLLALALTLGVFSLVGMLKQDLFSAEDYSYFNIEIITPRGTSLDETNRIVGQYEKVLLDKVGNGDILSISTKIGTLGSGEANSTKAQITVDLAEMDEGRTRGINEVITEVQNETYYISGAEQVFFRKAQNGPPTADPLSFRFTGDEYKQLIDGSNAVINLLNSIDGVSNVESDFIAGSPELRIRLDQERASALGVNVKSVGSFIRARFDSIPSGIFFEKNEQIDIVVRFSSSDSRRFENLEQLLIPTDDGRLVPLSSVATIELDNSLGTIRRVEGKREITVTANALDSVDLKQVNEQVQQLWQQSLGERYPDVAFSVGGEFSDFGNLIFDILRVFVLGIFLMYLILGTQFNSYSQPLLILFSVPFAFIGVVLYLFVSGTPLSTTVIYSAVALAGIAVNDAIVLISFINELRGEGKGVREAIGEAAQTRLRPIILTSVTTIVGLLPTAIGVGGYSVVWSPMASTIIFGLLFSTLTALFIIPMLYGTIYDKKKKRSAT